MHLLFRLRLLIAILGFAATMPLGAQVTIGRAGAVITEFAGTVLVQTGSEKPRPFKRGQPLVPGTILHTEQGSSAVLVYPDGQICIIGASTRFRIVDYRYDARNPAGNGVSLNLIEGSMRMVMGDIGRTDPAAVRVQIGTATLSPLPTPDSPGTTDASVVVQGGPVAVTVDRGRVTVMTPAGPAQQVGDGQGLYISADGALRQGETGEVIRFLSQLSNGPDMQRQFADLRGFGAKLAQTIITMATVTAAIKAPELLGGATAQQVAAAEILKQLESLPPPGSVTSAPELPASPFGSPGSAGTPSTGGGGGGTPCGASCN